MCSHSPLFMHINYIDTVPLLLLYFGQKTNVSWKRWVELAAKEELCITGWTDGILPPGLDFEIRKMGAGELREITGSYVDSTLKNKDRYEAFSVARWSTGV